MVLHASAQADGRFAGTVLDSSGAFVPGATVTVKNEKTGEERTATSSAQGIYVVANLKPSTYTIRASRAISPLWNSPACSSWPVRSFTSIWS
jgi:protocatechuate 3,4-dioxygenase beta subunit